MKIIDKEITTITKKVYEAFDGTVFSNERDCERYEMEEKRKAIMSDPEIHFLADLEDMTPTDGDYHNNENTFLWFKCDTRGALERLKDAYFPEYSYQRHGYNDCDRRICIEVNWDDECYYSSDTDSIEYARKLLHKLGYDVVKVD